MLTGGATPALFLELVPCDPGHHSCRLSQSFHFHTVQDLGALFALDADALGDVHNGVDALAFERVQIGGDLVLQFVVLGVIYLQGRVSS